LKRSFTTIVRQALQRRGYASLRAFYQSHSFSFGYEYLRQILSQEKVPTAKIVAEIAETLGLREADLQKAAAEERLARKIRHYYRLPSATRIGRLSEKIQRYRAEGREEAKLLRMIGRLGKREKEQLVDYLKFLKRQCRRQDRQKR
jgi:hypothetical protein